MKLDKFFVEAYAEKYKSITDKYELGYIQEFYNDLFTPRKDSTKNVLEIGTFYGGSTFLWRDYFSNATIFALDVHQCTNFLNEERIVHIVGDSYDEDFIKRLPKNFYDIVIDDGPHSYESMVVFLTKYFPLLKSGGVMVLEDIVNTEWTKNLIRFIDINLCNYYVVNMAGKQKNTELNQIWLSGLDVIIIQKK